MYDLIVRGGRVVTPRAVVEAEIGVADGRIAAIGRDLGEAAETIDATGKLVFPGAIDPHVHLNDPGFTWREDFAHGTAAAAAGGVTTVIDMPLQNEPTLVGAAEFENKHKVVGPKALVDYAFLGGALDCNLDELAGLNAAGAVGFKVFVGPVSPDYQSLDMGTVREVLRQVKKFDGLVCFHAEDYSIIKYEEAKAQRKGRAGWSDFLDSRPLVAEIIATRNIVDLVRESGTRAHICHISHPDVAEIVREAQEEGLPVSGETCTHYLVFSEGDLLKNGSLFKCAPPLRKEVDRDRLWKYVEEGVVGCVGSDHSPCKPEEKTGLVDGAFSAFGAWGGISGIQSTMQVLYDRAVNIRGCDPTLIAKRLSEDTAKIFGLYGRKGAIEIGFDADLVVLDPERAWEITPESLFYLNKISAFVGLKGHGLPVRTIVRGRTVFEDGAVKAEYDCGQLVKPVRGGGR